MLRAKLPQQYGADRYAAGREAIRSQNEDSRRGEFLRAIDGDAVTLNEFEAGFVADFVRQRGKADPALDFQWFTPNRRTVVDRMIQRYGMRFVKPVPNVTTLPPAEAGKCEYLVKGERRNERCGQPATVSRNGFSLCAACDEIRARGLQQLRDSKKRSLRS